MNDASGLLSEVRFALVAVNSFAFIVTLTTSDSNFYLSTSTWNLPLVNVTVTLIQFAYIALFILLGGQLYRHLVYRSLKRDWDAVDDAEKVAQYRLLNWIAAGTFILRLNKPVSVNSVFSHMLLGRCTNLSSRV